MIFFLKIRYAEYRINVCVIEVNTCHGFFISYLQIFHVLC